MKLHKKQLFILILIFLLVVIAVVLTYAYVNDTWKEEEVEKISVIVYGSNTDRWSTLRQGLGQGADDFHIEINFVTTSSENNFKEQKRLIEREMENGADGIILAAASSSSMDETVKEIAEKLPVVTIETDVKNASALSYISADNYSMGLNIGRSVILNNNLEEKIAVLISNDQRESVIDRYRGLSNSLEHTQNTIIEWKMGDNDFNQTLFVKKMMKEEPVDVIVALDDTGLESVVDAITESDIEVEAFGIGSTDKIVHYLDEGVIKAIVFQNEFNMGYLGVQVIVNDLRNEEEIIDTKIEYRAVNKKTMYNSDNQRLLFPIVQ